MISTSNLIQRPDNDELQTPLPEPLDAYRLESVVKELGCGAGANVDLFMSEHSNMRRLLALIDAELSRAALEQAPDYPLVLTAIHYLTRFIDNFHHAREDGAVELAALRVPRLAAVAGAVAEQHESVLFTGGALWGLLERAFADQPVLRSQILDAGRAYSRLLRQHLDYEEQFLFPVLAEVLTPNDWAIIDTNFGLISDPLFGPIVGERYRQLRARLQGSEPTSSSQRLA